MPHTPQEPPADKRLHQQRLSICAGCPERRSGVLDICRRCGCILVLKTRVKTQHCPMGKW